MRVLEINDYTEFARDSAYEGKHEVRRFLVGRRESSLDKRRVERGELLGSFAEVKKFDPEVLVCPAFGRCYGQPKWKRPFKYSLESLAAKRIGKLRRQLEIPLGIIDTSDDLMVHPVNRELLRAGDLYFKRELALDPFVSLGAFDHGKFRRPERRRRLENSPLRWLEKLRPFPLGLDGELPSVSEKPFADRKWDVFYAGAGELRPLREEGERLLVRLAELGVRVFHSQERLSAEEYFKAMADSRVVFSPPGFGWDCHRHYEAALHGCVVLTSFPSICRRVVFEDKVNCLYYDPSHLDLASAVKRAMEQSNLEAIAENGRMLVQARLTHAAIFSETIELLQKESLLS